MQAFAEYVSVNFVRIEIFILEVQEDFFSAS